MPLSQRNCWIIEFWLRFHVLFCRWFSTDVSWFSTPWLTSRRPRVAYPRRSWRICSRWTIESSTTSTSITCHLFGVSRHYSGLEFATICRVMEASIVSFLLPFGSALTIGFIVTQITFLRGKLTESQLWTGTTGASFLCPFHWILNHNQCFSWFYSKDNSKKRQKNAISKIRIWPSIFTLKSPTISWARGAEVIRSPSNTPRFSECGEMSSSVDIFRKSVMISNELLRPDSIWLTKKVKPTVKYLCNLSCS